MANRICFPAKNGFSIYNLIAVLFGVSIINILHAQNTAPTGNAIWGKPVETIGNHPAIRDSHGVLLPWTSWRDALHREMDWYL
jgi:hypothetical protein